MTRTHLSSWITLFTIVWATPSRAEFKFFDAPARGACSFSEREKVAEVAAATDDVMVYAIATLNAFGGSSIPDRSGNLDELEEWLGPMPPGDPMHPTEALSAWQDGLRSVGNTLMEARTGLLHKEVFVLCVTADLPACSVLDPVGDDVFPGGGTGAEEEYVDAPIGAFSSKINVAGKTDPMLVIGLCPPFWPLARRGNYDTQAPVLAHELAHLFGSVRIVDDPAGYGVLDAHELSKDGARARRNGSTVQYIVGGLDNRRMGGPGSSAIVPAVVMAIEGSGCAVGGARPVSFWWVVVLVALAMRRLDKSPR